jgi:YidC/Oxa1 family membrane protein insertase
MTGNRRLEDKRNFIMAILLAGLILVGGQYITSRYFPAPKPVPAQSPTTTSTAGTAAPSAGPATPGGNLGTAPNIAGAKTLPLNAALASSGRVRIQTPKLKGSINLQGAQIDDLLLLAHRTELAKNSPPVRLFAPSGTENPISLGSAGLPQA